VSPSKPPETAAPSGDVPEIVLRKTVPQIVLARNRPSVWPGEFRVVTAAYVTLRHPDYASPEDTLATLQDSAQRVQACLARFEGQIYEILAGEAGTTFIAVFGLPPWSHEDDAARAVTSALALHREWGALGLTSSTGIATGRIFWGVVQTKTDRAVLALVGPIMNLAARLMQLNAGVVCDEETTQAGRQSGRIFARRLTPRTVRGKSEPIAAFAAYDAGGSTWPAPTIDQSTVIGRHRELSALLNAVTNALAGIGGVVVIEGDAGIGKTTLVNRVAAEARDGGAIVLAGGGDSTDQTTVYLAWRRVFLDLLEQSDLPLRTAATRPPGPDAAAQRDHSGKTTIPLGAFARLAPLLEDMLGLEAVDNSETALLRGQPRADALARLLRDLLLEAANRVPIVVILEDMHWLDPTSLSLFGALCASRAPLLLLGATRGPDATPSVRKSIAHAEDVVWLHPEPLNGAETGSLVARTLGAREADEGLAEMFRGRTGGNPLFVEELSRMAFTNRLLFIDGRVQARSSVANARGELDDILERQGLPSTIEGVIRRRLDSLSHQDISVLRAASVVGQRFDRDLCSIGAPTLTATAVDASLAALIGIGVIEPADRAPNEFKFSHEVLRDVVYNTMSFAERRQIHDSIGSWIEQHPHIEDVSALLGRHFLQAQRVDKAIPYFISAGEVATRRYANAEAIEILMRAHELHRRDAGSSGGIGRAEKARLSLLLGRAFLGLSRYSECRTHSETGLRLAGFPTPANTLSVVLGLLAQTAQQVRNRYWPSKREASDAEKDDLRKTVLAFEALAETYFYQGDGPRTLYAAMSTLNLSERLGPSSELARGCATVSGISGLFRLRRISGHYSARALDILNRLDEPAAETWVFILLGLSKLGEGRWEESKTYLENVLTAANKIGDRRRWRDGVENTAIIEACRGKWQRAIESFSEMLASAEQDKDQRYRVLVYRERAYCYLQLGNLNAADEHLQLIKAELDRGLTAEELPTRQDFHAIAATIALERGDEFKALQEADAALEVIKRISGTSSVPNMYWTVFLVARVFGNLHLKAFVKDTAHRPLLRDMANTCRSLSTQAWSHPIAGPSAGIARGYLENLRGRPARAKRLWQRAEAEARRLDMDYETQLASVETTVDSGRKGDLSGLPFLNVGSRTVADQP
jgi:class 3 adenylate cyclase/tetratricopeptide (TPR) repeat protein